MTSHDIFIQIVNIIILIRMIQVHSSFAFMHESLIQLYEMSIVAMVMQIVCYKYAINPT